MDTEFLKALLFFVFLFVAFVSSFFGEVLGIPEITSWVATIGWILIGFSIHHGSTASSSTSASKSVNNPDKSANNSTESAQSSPQAQTSIAPQVETTSQQPEKKTGRHPLTASEKAKLLTVSQQPNTQQQPAAQKMKCPHCGAEVQLGEIFCAECGYEI